MSDRVIRMNCIIDPIFDRYSFCSCKSLHFPSILGNFKFASRRITPFAIRHVPVLQEIEDCTLLVKFNYTGATITMDTHPHKFTTVHIALNFHRPHFRNPFHESICDILVTQWQN